MPSVVKRTAQRGPRISIRTVRVRADRMLAELGEGEAELSVLLSSDAQIHELNRKHRKKNKPTDVLSFPMDAAVAPPDAPRLLGDVVISLETAARQARTRGHSLLAEVTHLLSHGLLHLVGYDHRTDAEERRMDKKAARLVSAACSQTAPSTKLVRSIRDSRLTSRSR